MIPILTPRTFAHALFKRFKLLMFVFAGTSAAATAYVLIATPTYESQASILSKVADQDVATPDVLSNAEARGSTTAASIAQQFVNSEQLLFRSRDVLDGAISKLGAETIYPGIAAAAHRRGVPVNDVAADKLERDLDVKVDQDTSVLVARLYNPDPRIAQLTLRTIIGQLFDKQASVMRDPRTSFVGAQEEMLRKRALNAQQVLVAFRNSTGINSLDDERTLLLKQRDQLQLDLSDTQAQESSDRTRLAQLQHDLSRTDQYVELTDENDRTSTELDDAQAHLSQAQMRYEEAQQTFAVGNPELIDAQQQLQLARKTYDDLQRTSSSRVRTGLNPDYESIDTARSSTQAELSGLTSAEKSRQAQLDAVNQRLAFLDSKGPEFIELQNRADSAQHEFQSYLERNHAAEILADLNSAGLTSSLSVIQAPTLAYEPVRPKATLLLPLGCIVGLALGIGLCLLAELLDTSISLPEQIEPLLGVPLLLTLQFNDAPPPRAALPRRK